MPSKLSTMPCFVISAYSCHASVSSASLLLFYISVLNILFLMAVWLFDQPISSSSFVCMNSTYHQISCLRIVHFASSTLGHGLGFIFIHIRYTCLLVDEIRILLRLHLYRFIFGFQLLVAMPTYCSDAMAGGHGHLVTQ